MWKVIKATWKEKLTFIKHHGLRNTAKKTLFSGHEYDRWSRSQEKETLLREADAPGMELTVLASKHIKRKADISGDYVLMLPHGDRLEKGAAREFLNAAVREGMPDLLYSDEDEETFLFGRRRSPHFKPDYNDTLLCASNYIRHGFAVKTKLWQECMAEVDIQQAGWTYDLLLRCTEKARGICHIPKVLYHHHRKGWLRRLKEEQKAWEQGRIYLEAHHARMGTPARVTEGEWVGTYRTEYAWKTEPLVSVLIPNMDHAKDLACCVESVLKQSSYRNLEILIIENNSLESDTFELYRKLEQSDERVRILSWEDTFNYARINNFGAGFAKGELFLFLNNDTRMIGANSIRALVDQCQRPGVGVAGAKLFYGDGTLQHAGVVIGYGGTAGHAFITMPGDYVGYERRAVLPQNYSAVTAACMMTKREVFESVGGFRESFSVAYNDIDYCLKVGEKGQKVVYEPASTWFHYESKSRGYEDTPEKQARFAAEQAHFQTVWKDLLEKGDPCYNPNLSLDRADFARKSEYV